MKKLFKVFSVLTLLAFIVFSFLYFTRNELFTNTTLYCVVCLFYVINCTTMISLMNSYPIVGGTLIVSNAEEPYRFEFNTLLSELENEKSFIIEIEENNVYKLQ